MNGSGSHAPVQGYMDRTDNTWRHNVYMGPQLWSGSGPDPLVDVDHNCYIWTNPFPGSDSHSTFAAYVSGTGHDPDSTRVVTADTSAVFNDPQNGDFTLIGAAATACAGKGAQ
jgi:hypothetical protein